MDAIVEEFSFEKCDAYNFHQKSNRWRFHWWTEKLHPWMKVPSFDVIHGWRNVIHGWRDAIHGWRNVIRGCHPWMERCHPWMEKCHPWMKVSSVDVIHGCHSWMEECHPWMRVSSMDGETSSIYDIYGWKWQMADIDGAKMSAVNRVNAVRVMRTVCIP